MSIKARPITSPFRPFLKPLRPTPPRSLSRLLPRGSTLCAQDAVLAFRPLLWQSVNCWIRGVYFRRAFCSGMSTSYDNTLGALLVGGLASGMYVHSHCTHQASSYPFRLSLFGATCVNTSAFFRRTTTPPQSGIMKTAVSTA